MAILLAGTHRASAEDQLPGKAVMHGDKAQRVGELLLSPLMKDAIMRGAPVYAYLEGLDLKAETGTSVSVYIAPSGTNVKNDDEWEPFFVGTLSEFRNGHQMKYWRVFDVRDVYAAPAGQEWSDDLGTAERGGIPITEALTKLKEYIATTPRPTLELVMSVRTGQVKFDRLTLSTRPPGPNDTPEGRLEDKLLRPASVGVVTPSVYLNEHDADHVTVSCDGNEIAPTRDAVTGLLQVACAGVLSVIPTPTPSMPDPALPGSANPDGAAVEPEHAHVTGD